MSTESRWSELGLIVAMTLALGACSGGASQSPAVGDTTDSPARTARDEGPEAIAAAEQAPSVRDEAGPIPHFADGTLQASLSEAAVNARSLTEVELGEDWTPGVLAEDSTLGRRGRQPYRRSFLRLANERARRLRLEDRFLELYGIFPTLHLLQERLNDEERHTCHDAVEDADLEAMENTLRPGAHAGRQRRQAGATRHLRGQLERAMERRGVSSFEELREDRRYGSILRRYERVAPQVNAIVATQAHLRCEGFLSSRARNGVFDAWTARGLRAWQRRHMIISMGGRLDEVSRRSLTTDSRELDLLDLLRILRERVISATGLLEDGTASNNWGEVVGRQIDLDDEFRWARRLDPLPDGAPDLVSQATDAAARALGWTDPAGARSWLNEHAGESAESRVVALPLPPPPAYHSDHMDLHVRIHRGDVYYAFPYTDDGRPRGRRVRRRPTTVIFARHEGRDIPLVRWNTTIGSWQPEINPEGGVGMRYKESDVGDRVWRDIIASPAWLPPPSTPDGELLRQNRSSGTWRLNNSITGPGYDSAYGLAMVIHHLVRNDGSEERDWLDRGIRSHGSVSYRSILRGYSHGCHRLFNHLAVRMMSFLLDHRPHQTHGRIPALYRRELRPDDGSEPLTMEIDNRGFRYELTPPVPVTVLRGNVRGRPNRPLAGFYPLPEELQAQAQEQIAADPAAAPTAQTPAPTTP